MSFGKELGKFTSTATTITKSGTPGGGAKFDLNTEGTVSGGWKGAVLVSLSLSTPDFETGTYTSSVAVYLEDGSVLTGEGSGVFKALGGHKWQLNGTDRISDGTLVATESTMALATRTMDGSIFAIN